MGRNDERIEPAPTGVTPIDIMQFILGHFMQANLRKMASNELCTPRLSKGRRRDLLDRDGQANDLLKLLFKSAQCFVYIFTSSDLIYSMHGILR
jgi:hypothetical protein